MGLSIDCRADSGLERCPEYFASAQAALGLGVPQGQRQTVMSVSRVWSNERMADSDNSQEMRILLGRKTLTNLDSLLKSRGIPLLTHVCIDKATVFLLVMYK